MLEETRGNSEQMLILLGNIVDHSTATGRFHDVWQRRSGRTPNERYVGEGGGGQAQHMEERGAAAQAVSCRQRRVSSGNRRDMGQ